MFNIAFLGLGAMGSRMAAHLIKAGYKVTVWNRSEEAMAPLVNQGATAAATPALAASNADFVISMVRDDQASQYVWLDERAGALQAMPKHSVAIESSTLTPDWVRTLAAAFSRADISFADAPVAGSLPQAEAAKLIYFVGCEAQTFERILPVLSTMGCVVHHCGSISSGANIKLAFNALFGIQLAAVAELLGLLKNSGMDIKQAIEILASTPVFSPAAKFSAETMVAGNFTPTFPIELVQKDFSYVKSAAAQVQTNTPISVATRQVLQNAIEQGFGKDNITGIAQLYL